MRARSASTTSWTMFRAEGFARRRGDRRDASRARRASRSCKVAQPQARSTAIGGNLRRPPCPTSTFAVEPIDPHERTPPSARSPLSPATTQRCPSLGAALRRGSRRDACARAPLSDEDCAIQSMPDASPVKWHLAHTSWFFETFVLDATSARLPRIRSGVPDAVQFVLQRRRRQASAPAARHCCRGRRAPTWSRIASTSTRRCRRCCNAPHRWRPTSVALIELGFNHEQQHQELILTDVLHMLSCNPLAPGVSSPRMRPRAGDRRRR